MIGLVSKTSFGSKTRRTVIFTLVSDITTHEVYKQITITCTDVRISGFLKLFSKESLHAVKVKGYDLLTMFS